MPRGDNPKLFTLGGFDRATDESGVFDFGENDDVIGFYGAQSPQALRTLGFLTKNTQCIVEALGEEVLEEPEVEESSDEGSSLTVIVIIIVVVVIVIVIIVIVVVHCCCRKPRTSSRVHILN